MHPGGQETKSDAFLVHVRELVSAQQYDTWFRAVSLHVEADGGLVLLVPNKFVRDWVSSYYSDVLAQAVRRSFGEARSVTIAVDPNAPPLKVAVAPEAGAEPELPEGPESPEPGAQPLPRVETGSLDSDTVLHDQYTFENYVVGAGNRFAFAAATAVAEAPGKNYNPFFLHGSVGLGKTHLLQAICHQILRTRPNSRILYLSCESFINQFIEALENRDVAAFRQKYRNVDVLLVDDIQFLANKERTQEEFFHTFNTIYNLGNQIVLSSDAPPKEIPTLQERLVSRFKMGLVVEMAPPDFETRVAILKRKARMREMDLPDEVAHFLAEHVSTNIRELEGAVVRVLGYASLEGRPLDIEVARDAMRDGAVSRSNAITINDVIRVVTDYFSVKLPDLQSKRRTQSIAFPRQICMFLARENTDLSLSEIGGYFGGRDHTTVLYAIEKIREDAANDASLAELLRRLTTGIRS